jgi:hypothetical protein
MNFKLIAGITLVVAIPTGVYAQQDGPDADAPKPTMADVQKLVQSIAADKVKLKAYCDMGQIQEQMEQIEQEKGSAEELDALSAKAESLSEQLGSDYEMVMSGLDGVDPNSAEGNFCHQQAALRCREIKLLLAVHDRPGFRPISGSA